MTTLLTITKAGKLQLKQMSTETCCLSVLLSELHITEKRHNNIQRSASWKTLYNHRVLNLRYNKNCQYSEKLKPQQIIPAVQYLNTWIDLCQRSGSYYTLWLWVLIMDITPCHQYTAMPAYTVRPGSIVHSIQF